MPRSHHQRAPAVLAVLAGVALFPGVVVRASGMSARARTAAATFGPVRTLAASGLVLNSQAPVAAINARGESLVAWAEEGPRGIAGRLFVRRGQPDGRFAPTLRLGSDQMGSGSQSISVAPDGTEVVAWQDSSSNGSSGLIEVAIARPGQPFGRPQVLASVGGGPLVGGSLTFPQVVALKGRIAVTWGQQNPASGFFAPRPKPYLAAAIANAGARFGPAAPVPGTSTGGVLSVAAASDPRGDIVAVYTRAVGNLPFAQERTRLDYVVLRAGSAAWQRPRPIADPMIGTQTPLGWDGLSVGPGGVETTYTLDTKSSQIMRVARLGADATFAAARTVGTPSALGPGVPSVSGATIALPLRGPALAAWTTTDWGLGQALSAGVVNVATQRPNGSFAAPILLSAGSPPAQYVLAAATTDRVIVLWADGQPLHQDLIYAVRDRHGHFSTARLLAPAAASDPTLATAGTHAIAAWVSANTLQAAGFSG